MNDGAVSLRLINETGVGRAEREAHLTLAGATQHFQYGWFTHTP